MFGRMGMKQNVKIMEDLFRQIVDLVHPSRIIVFGSTVRNECGTGSDIDLLVVMPEGVHRRRTAQKIYRRVRGVGLSFDVVVATAEDLRRHRDNPGLIYGTIVREGREVYAA